jgi:hypothetical protein
MLAHIAVRTGEASVCSRSTRSSGIHCSRSRPGWCEPTVRASYDLHRELLESDDDAAFTTLAMRQRKRVFVVNFTQDARRRGRAQGASGCGHWR